MRIETLDLKLEKQRFWIGAGIVLLVTGVMEVTGLTTPLKSFVQILHRPFLQTAASAVQVVKFPYFVATKSYQSYVRIQDLELRYAEAIAQLSELNSLKKENEELRQLLSGGNVTQNSLRSVATILGYGQPLIERSDTEVVVEGAMVLVGETLIGRVGKVTEHQAEVLLLSQSNGPTILAQTESGVTGIVTGDGREVVMKEIPSETEVREGEKVVTVGQPGVQAGLSLGQVKSVVKKHGAATQTAVITQYVSFYESRVVQVRK